MTASQFRQVRELLADAERVGASRVRAITGVEPALRPVHVEVGLCRQRGWSIEPVGARTIYSAATWPPG
jgi:hypothetical protein